KPPRLTGLEGSPTRVCPSAPTRRPGRTLPPCPVAGLDPVCQSGVPSTRPISHDPASQPNPHEPLDLSVGCCPAGPEPFGRVPGRPGVKGEGWSHSGRRDWPRLGGPRRADVCTDGAAPPLRGTPATSFSRLRCLKGR